jgi:hypothetical protein
VFQPFGAADAGAAFNVTARERFVAFGGFAINSNTSGVFRLSFFVRQKLTGFVFYI